MIIYSVYFALYIPRSCHEVYNKKVDIQTRGYPSLPRATIVIEVGASIAQNGGLIGCEIVIALRETLPFEKQGNLVWILTFLFTSVRPLSTNRLSSLIYVRTLSRSLRLGEPRTRRIRSTDEALFLPSFLPTFLPFRSYLPIPRRIKQDNYYPCDRYPPIDDLISRLDSFTSRKVTLDKVDLRRKISAKFNDI